jgi:hypothetical protein
MRNKRNLSTSKSSSQRKKQMHRQQIKMINRRQFYFNQGILTEQDSCINAD